MEQEKEQAFIKAVQDRREQMYRIAMRYLHSPQDAEDAVSAATEATWRNLKRIRNIDTIPAYLIRCTVNAAKYELRKKLKVKATKSLPEVLPADETGDPIMHYLSGMNDRDQLIMILKYQENLREKEIASILRIPRGTVSSRINTLIRKIRKDLFTEETDND